MAKSTSATTTNVLMVGELLTKLEKTKEETSLKILSTFLEYSLIKNPIDPWSEWHLLSHPELDDDSQALMSIIYDEDLNGETTVRELRKRYELVEAQKEKFRGFDVYLYGFIGKGRILIFKGYDSNRDERLDISKQSIDKVSLFADNLVELSVDKVAIKEDDFGFGKEVVNLDLLFKRELSNLFGLTVQLYRKQIAELITSNKSLEKKIMELLPNYEKRTLKKQSLNYKLLNVSFKQAIGSVIDTIVLRVVLRRFLESYHGLGAFSSQDDFKDVGLGIREGKMQEVIQYLAEIEHKTITERSLRDAIDNQNVGQSWDLFELVSLGVTKKETEVSFEEIYTRLRKQFEIAYGGDLFSSDISEVVNAVEEEINKINPDLLLHLLVDTSEDRFNFRYEDLPPEMIQDFYETSMGHSLHYTVNEKDEAVVSYSDDLQERKQKGAYYTRQELVDYMVAQTIGKKMNDYQDKLNRAIKNGKQKEIESVLNEIISMTIIDITCGGGSFLRGAFRFLAVKRNSIVRTLENLSDKYMYDILIEKYPYFADGIEAETLWEKHVLLEMVYGIDIDYKALIISSQTLTLSALSNWKVGVNFPRLIGLTLMQQNALIGPVRMEERKEAFKKHKSVIKELIRIRKGIRAETNAIIADELTEKLNKIRLSIQERLNCNVENIIDKEYKEALMSQSIEINFPEVFFDENGEVKENGGFTVSLGNPPWEIWKPNSDEYFSVYNSRFRSANRREKLKMQQDIFENNPEIQEKWNWYQGYYETGSEYFLQNEFYNYQRVKVEGRYTGSDINLYKVSLEKNYQILAKNGTCSYLVPSSVYTDRGATGLRRLIFNKTDLREIAGFENRKKIFENVDSRYKFAVVTFTKGHKTEQFRGFFYKHYLEDLHQPENFIDIPIDVVKKFSPNLLSVLEFRERKELDLIKKMTKFPLLSEHREDTWNVKFIREFDMTSDSGLFNTDKQGNPLLEGKNIWQYSKNEEYNYFVKVKTARDTLESKEKNRISRLEGDVVIPSTVPIHTDYYRLGYRTIARSNDKRTLITTIVPKNIFCGNSVATTIPYELEQRNGKLYRKENYSLKDLLVMTGLFNSFIVDFIVRRKTSANVNMFIMYELPVPRIVEGDMYYNEILKRSGQLICNSRHYDELKQVAGIKEGVENEVVRQQLKNQIDAYVAMIYGVNRDELLYILSTFKSTNHAEEMSKIAQNVIEQFDILTEKGGLECPS